MTQACEMPGQCFMRILEFAARLVVVFGSRRANGNQQRMASRLYALLRSVQHG